MKLLLVAVYGLVVLVSNVWAGSPHFISCSVGINNGTICASGKEAGLGNEPQINVILGGMAHCVNRGDNAPSAQNKITYSAEEIVPVQNGKALYELCVELEFIPECSPPMIVEVDSVVLFDTTSGISCVLSDETLNE